MMIETERCYVRVRAVEDASRYSVEILEHSRLTFLRFLPGRHGKIDASQVSVMYEEVDLERDLSHAPEPLFEGEVVLVHLTLRGDHVVRWRKLEERERRAA